MDQLAVAKSLLSDLQAGAESLPATQQALTSLVSKDYPGLRDVNEAAAVLARQTSAALVGSISEAKKKNVASLVARAIDYGWSDKVLANKIAQVVGLDARYAQAVQNFGSREANKGRPKGIVAREVDAYATRLRNHRAMVIARNEVQAVLLGAQRLLWAQQQQDGDISRYAVRVTHVRKDERLCGICRPQNGKRRSLKAGVGGGPPFHPVCRCFEVLEDQGIAKTDPELWGDGPEEIEKVDRVRTMAGVKRFHLPLGAPIVARTDVPSLKTTGITQLSLFAAPPPDVRLTRGQSLEDRLIDFAERHDATFRDPNFDWDQDQRRLYGGAMNEGIIRVHDGDHDYIVKKAFSEDIHNEEVGGQVAVALELAYAAVPIGQRVVVVPYVNGSTGVHLLNDLDIYGVANATELLAVQRKRDALLDKTMAVAVFDYITNNTDRHGGNWMVDAMTGEVVPIDHGFIRPKPDGDEVEDVWNFVAGDGASTIWQHWIKPQQQMKMAKRINDLIRWRTNLSQSYGIDSFERDEMVKRFDALIFWLEGAGT